MRLVIQRVLRASVSVLDDVIGSIEGGLLVLAAVEKGDGPEDAVTAAKKIPELRMFSDQAGKMNLSLVETGGSILAVSQFTLAASLDRGRRPGFEKAEEPERAAALFAQFVGELRTGGVRVETGAFGEYMIVSLENDGPVTFVYDTRRR